ncbi:VWA domain-containing protein [Candidatus Uhrbacteria bacterium]|nr:VWA domain-containing protein [Candidatus Uhrbacteria bacterium]
MKNVQRNLLLLMGSLLLLFTSCKPREEQSDVPTQSQTQNGPETFRVIAGSENKDLEPILQRFAKQEGASLNVTYLGSVDIALQLESGNVEADAVWPASSLWIQFADRNKIVKNTKSVARSPIVFGVKMSRAKELKWTDRTVSVSDIQSTAENGNLRFAMTSATQSNSGASAYLGFLSAYAGSPDVLLSEHLQNVDVQDKTRKLLATVDRSSGSSGWLRDQIVKDPTSFDAMVNYEAMLISANRDLVAQGQEPLCAVYPRDGLTMADFPLGFIDHANPAKVAFFGRLQDYLLSAPVQSEIERLGRRTSLVGIESNATDIFNPAWCIDTKRTISSVPLPSAQVIREALELYQTLLRKPSFSVFVLDYSGSMSGEREQAMKKAMGTLLNPESARRYMLQPSGRDINVVIPFSAEVIDVWKTEGNDPPLLHHLLQNIQQMNTSGGTSLYTATAKALAYMEDYQAEHPNRKDPKHLSAYFPAIILMTDGEATDEKSILDEYLRQHPTAKDTPIFGIRFGEASESQLDALTQKGRVFDGTKDLAKAMREAKQYN